MSLRIGLLLAESSSYEHILHELGLIKVYTELMSYFSSVCCVQIPLPFIVLGSLVGCLYNAEVQNVNLIVISV